MRQFIFLWSCILSSNVLALPTQNGLSQGEITRVFTGLLLVLLIIACLAWAVKRMQVVRFGASKGLETITSMAVGPKERIMLMKIGNRYLLIGVGAGVINTLCDFGTQLPEGLELNTKPGFAQILKSASGTS